MEDRISENQTINELYNVSPYFDVIFDNEISMAITDKEKYLYSKYCDELVLGANKGDLIPKEGAVSDALISGKTIVKVVPEHVYGVPFKSYAIPIKEGNEVVGVFVVGKSLAKKNEVTNIASNLADSLSQISIGINEVALGVQQLATMNEEVLGQSKEANDRAKDTDEVVNFIQGVSSQTNLLGLNAAIEAARAGENGKGFNVVAQEIRKLSNSSSESIKKIDSVIKNISVSIQNITDKLTSANEVSQSQSAALEQITASITELNSTSKLLEELSEKL
ncbi:MULTISPECIES: methyl-accepting chemotaxis protein [Clostridium]|uniref:Chemotaxis protein n=1 Tax=Clostridium cibarium TaxID=2762247 RepID=A0ABR8PYZ0_9CLOT|nr:MULTISPECIES: methyl-accepting chemotaxis protein [Clostridium]MBD7913371.1 chemotaxis protein [Clostridium cibarium]